jgi:hypothetical protein
MDSTEHRSYNHHGYVTTIHSKSELARHSLETREVILTDHKVSELLSNVGTAMLTNNLERHCNQQSQQLMSRWEGAIRQHDAWLRLVGMK